MSNCRIKERTHSPRTSLFPGTVWIGCHVSQKRKCRGPSASQFSLPTSVWVAVSQLSIGEMGRMSPAGSWLPHIRGGECLHVIGTHTATHSLPNPISRNTTIYIQSMAADSKETMRWNFSGVTAIFLFQFYTTCIATSSSQLSFKRNQMPKHFHFLSMSYDLILVFV